MGAGAIVSSIKVRAKVGSGYVVQSNEYVVATYSGFEAQVAGGSYPYAVPSAQVWWGPGDTVAGTNGISTFLTAVCFINSP